MEAGLKSDWLEMGKITDEALKKMRSRIGMKLRPSIIFNNEGTRDAIWHFADGIGDNNPLWRDIEYAKKTRFGCLVAPHLGSPGAAWCACISFRE